jgi:hypothetical protein
VYFDFFEEVSSSNSVFGDIEAALVHLHLLTLPSTHLVSLVSLLYQAFNYISNKGYSRMAREDEKHWVDLMNVIHDSVKGGMKYNTGTLLMVLSRPVALDKIPPVTEKSEKPVSNKVKTPAKETLPKNLNP